MLRVHLANQEMDLLSRDAHKLFAHNLYGAILGHLIHKIGTTSIIPGLLDGWRSFDNYRRWHLRISSEARFHNGRSPTAVDLEYSLSRFFLNPNLLVEKSLVRPIAGLVDGIFVDGWHSGYARGLYIEDELTIIVELTDPRPRFVGIFEVSIISLMPREHLNEDGVTWKDWPVGAGPYKIVDVGANNFWLKVRWANDRDRGNAPYEIEFVTGELDDSFDLVLSRERAEGSPRRTTVVTRSTASITGLFFDYRHPLAKQNDYRKAIAAAVDRKKLTNQTSGVRPTNYILTHECRRYFGIPNSRWHKQDVPAFESSVTTHIAVARYKLHEPEQIWISTLQEQLLTKGLNVTFYEKNCAFFDPNISGNPFWIIRYIPSFRDPVLLFSVFEIGGSWIAESSNLDDNGYSLLVSEAMQQNGEGLRITLRKLSKMFTAEVRGVPLFENALVLSLDTNRLSHLEEAVQSGTLYFDRLQWHDD
jgi:hypothetical protein